MENLLADGIGLCEGKRKKKDNGRDKVRAERKRKKGVDPEYLHSVLRCDVYVSACLCVWLFWRLKIKHRGAVWWLKPGVVFVEKEKETTERRSA